jgi:hypothetical protein
MATHRSNLGVGLVFELQALRVDSLLAATGNMLGIIQASNLGFDFGDFTWH